jgi:hypothetical protein
LLLPYVCSTSLRGPFRTVASVCTSFIQRDYHNILISNSRNYKRGNVQNAQKEMEAGAGAADGGREKTRQGQGGMRTRRPFSILAAT